MMFRAAFTQQSRWLKPAVSTIALMSVLLSHTQVSANQTSNVPATPKLPPQLVQQPTVKKPTGERLPAAVANAVLRDRSRQLNVPVRTLQVTAFSQEVWSDTCLGLGRPEEGCGEALVSGWRVQLSDGSFYRTDRTGKSLRAEQLEDLGTLPQAVGDKILAVAAQSAGVPVSKLKIASARSRLWDGCLGVAGPNQPCTRIGIPGWQVIVAGPQQYWVYHSNQTGSTIKRNPTTSGKGTLVPTFWELDSRWFPAQMDETMLFQAITSGGFAGMTYKTVLYKDGRVVRMNVQGNALSAPTLIRQLSPRQLQQFIQTVQQQQFGDFQGFSYPAASGAADYFTIVLMGRGGATQYTDIFQEQTPAALQKTIQAWNRITAPTSR